VEKKMFKKSIFSCLAIASINLVSISAQAADTRYGTLLFDKTGSMQAIRADGRNRCEFGKNLFLTSLTNAMNKSDLEGRKLVEFLNLKTFDAPGNLTSISNGFVDVRSWSSTFGPGKIFYDAMAAKVIATQCDGSSTALGDAVCDTIADLRSQPTTAGSRLGIVTDAAENFSQVCNGPTYVTTHVVPRLIIAPPVTMSLSILTTPGGNVSFRTTNRMVDQQFENVPTNNNKVSIQEFEQKITSSKKVRLSPPALTEIQALKLAAALSGGGATIITDDKSCASNCDPLSQDPAFNDDGLGGGW
jgi:hypothetical protein